MDAFTLASEISRNRAASARAIARADAGEKYEHMWRAAGERMQHRAAELTAKARERLTTDPDLPRYLNLFGVTL